MTLRYKTILGMGLLFGAFALVIVSISNTLLSKSYQELEQDQALLQTKYLREGFNSIAKDMDSYALSVAKQESTLPYITSSGAISMSPEAQTILVRQLRERRINLLMLADVDGNIRLRTYMGNNTATPEELPQSTYAGLLKSIRGNFIAGTPKTVQGLIQLNPHLETLYIQAAPVLSAGNPVGFVVVGRLVAEQDIRNLRTLGKASIDYLFHYEENEDPIWSEALTAFANGEESFVKARDEEYLSTFATFRDLNGKPLLSIRVDSPRTFYQRGRSTLQLFMLLTISFGIVAIILSYSFLERYLMWRIRVLGSQLATIRRKKNPTLRLTVTGQDELGTLTEDINQTLVSLDEEQRQREQAQREHKVIVDSLKEVIFRIDTDGKWTYLNPAWKDLTGYSERETLEEYFGKLIYKDDLPTGHELIDNLLKGSMESGNVEVRFHTKSGAIRWVQVFARVMRSSHGDIEGITGTLFDITERINADERLRESEKLYRLVSENSTDVIFRLTLQGDILYTSRACLSVLGYTPEELKNTWIYDYCHPDDSMRVQKAYQKILEKGIISTIEHQIRQKNGKYLWVESVGKPITDEDGNPITDESGRLMELIITTRDITERKNNEQELLLREKALSSASCGILIADALKPECPIIYANKGFERMSGYSSDEYLGKHTFFISGPKTNHEQTEVLEEGLRQASEVDVTLQCYRKDGSTFWNRHAIAPLYDKGGSLTHFISVLTDVSDIKAIQEELEKAKDTSEAAKVVAEKANSAKSDFLAMMSHEIRTPMNAVIGFTDLLSNTPLDEEQQDHLSNINLSANALLTIINDILDFSKIEAGKFDLDPIPMVVMDIIEEAVVVVRHKANAKGIKLDYELSEEVPSTVIVDGVRLGQILRNLLSNAAKFTDRGRISIKLSADEIEETSCRLHFEVNDTGAGIPKDKLDRLFKSFSQVDSSTTRKHGGTGLGLAISKRLCEMMDGNISVESEPGKGSKFYFDIKVELDQELLQMPVATVLPIQNTENSPRFEQTQPAVPLQPVAEIKTPSASKTNPPIRATKKVAAASKPSGKTDDQPYRILVVEDNPANQLVLLKMLGQMGLSADLANHGKEAMELWLKQPYQVVLTDLQMPEMDGIELTKSLRDTEKSMGGAPCYIVGITANVLPEHKEGCLNAGMNDFLVKPLKMDALQRALQKYQPTVSAD